MMYKLQIKRIHIFLVYSIHIKFAKWKCSNLKNRFM